MWRPLIIIFLQIAIQLVSRDYSTLVSLVPGSGTILYQMIFNTRQSGWSGDQSQSVSNFAVRHPTPKTIRMSLFDNPWPSTESGYQHLTQQTFIYKHRSTRLAWTLHDTECSGAAWHGDGVVVMVMVFARCSIFWVICGCSAQCCLRCAPPGNSSHFNRPIVPTQSCTTPEPPANIFLIDQPNWNLTQRRASARNLNVDNDHNHFCAIAIQLFLAGQDHRWCIFYSAIKNVPTKPFPCVQCKVRNPLHSWTAPRQLQRQL